MSVPDVISLDREHFGPLPVDIGQEYEITLRGRVYRVEAERIDVTGFTGTKARAVLEGLTTVDLTILAVDVAR